MKDSNEAKARRKAREQAERDAWDAERYRELGHKAEQFRRKAEGSQVRELWRNVRPRGEDFLFDSRIDD